MTDVRATNQWVVLLVGGLFSVLLGAVLILWPGQTLTVITSVFGLVVIVSGVARFFAAMLDGEGEGRWVLMASGVVGVALGAVVFTNPSGAIGVIVLITGGFWLAFGMVDLYRAFTDDRLPDRGVRKVFGMFAIVLGILVLVWPAPTVLVMAIVTGVYAVIFGVLELVTALAIRTLTHG